jgi:hypothetical protein
MNARVPAVVAAAALTAAALLMPAAFAADDMKASLWVENTHLNMGRVVAGSTATATYVFHNEGDAEVHIVRATPT